MVIPKEIQEALDNMRQIATQIQPLLKEFEENDRIVQDYLHKYRVPAEKLRYGTLMGKIAYAEDVISEAEAIIKEEYFDPYEEKLSSCPVCGMEVRIRKVESWTDGHEVFEIVCPNGFHHQELRKRGISKALRVQRQDRKQAVKAWNEKTAEINVMLQQQH